jgi:hypothetical protein
MASSGGIQVAVNGVPAPAVAGDFADANPGFRVMAGPGGLVSGGTAYGVQPVVFLAGAVGTAIVGRFGWLSQQALDPDNAATIVNSFFVPGSGTAAAITGIVGLGAPDGFISRPDSPAIITQYLSDATMVIQEGAPVPLWAGGRGFWCVNDGAAAALVGMKAYAELATGKVHFAATGTPTSSSIAAGTWSATGTIAGNVMTLGTVTGAARPGATVTGSGVPSGVVIVDQLSGVAGAAGTYALNVGELTIASEALSGTFGILTVAGTITGTFEIGAIATGTLGSVAAGTQITGLGTGAGGAGTYFVNTTQTVGAQAVTFTSSVETQWIARSAGAPSELVKISTILQ